MRGAVTFSLLAARGAKASSRGYGFVGDEPVGLEVGGRGLALVTADRAIPIPKPERTPRPALGHRACSFDLPLRGEERPARVWLDPEVTCELLPVPAGVRGHVTAWHGTSAIGYVDDRDDTPSRAALWVGDRYTLLAGPDPTVGAIGLGLAADVQVGAIGETRKRACLWRGDAASFVDLAPADHETSRALGTDGDQQVGEVARELLRGHLVRAALWTGRADTFVDLTPSGVAAARAHGCAGGYQVGVTIADLRARAPRAIAWAGRADDAVDLHAAIGDAWTESTASAARRVGRTLVVVGTVRRAGAERACAWHVATG